MIGAVVSESVTDECAAAAAAVDVASIRDCVHLFTLSSGRSRYYCSSLQSDGLPTDADARETRRFFLRRINVRKEGGAGACEVFLVFVIVVLTDLQQLPVIPCSLDVAAFFKAAAGFDCSAFLSSLITDVCNAVFILVS